MIASLVAALTVGFAPATLELTPTDDVWVYPHATDNKDGYLRVWGADGTPVASSADDSDAFGYSYLKFDLSKVPSGGKLMGAKLVLFHVPEPAWTLDVAKAAPLQVRELKGKFDEKSWEYGQLKDAMPTKGKEAVYGTAMPDKVDSQNPIRFEVDLLKGPADFRKVTSNPVLNLALTSAMDPSTGNRSTYKFYSKDWEKAEFRPKLILNFE